MKIRQIIIGAIVVALICVLFTYSKYPSKWKSIHIGDTPEQVKTKCDIINTELHGIKGDFCYDSGFLFHWSLAVLYGTDDRVEESDLTLAFGTKDIFKAVNFGNIAK